MFPGPGMYAFPSAKAGSRITAVASRPWIPAFAGTTSLVIPVENSLLLVSRSGDDVGQQLVLDFGYLVLQQQLSLL